MASSTTPASRDQPLWTPPKPLPDVSLPPLKVYNSLTRRKEAFVPLDPSGKKVTWYCCGPTVYDAGHLGHARNYVTTDVLRRIMRDYFGYDVQFVQNVTDVDDKIILRGRQQHLLEEFKSKNPAITPDVLAAVFAAWNAYFKSKVSPDSEATPEIYQQWAQEKYPELISLILKEEELKASPSSEAVEEVTLDEKTTKLKMHLTTLFTASRALLASSKIQAEELYAATSSVLLPYLDTLNQNREYEPEVFSKLSSYWERHFNEDMATLNVVPPTTTTRVSEFIPENVAFVEKLVNKGFAYPTADGSVYFDIAAYEAAGHHYAKLQPWNRGDEGLMADGEGALTSDKTTTLPTTVDTTAETKVLQSKKNKQDFALWKASRQGEPSWESPWGKGRPGWHIECSVMCSEVLGGQVDIHSGGIDLAFPHHDNEIAQSEAYWDGCCDAQETLDNKHQWINYFLHMGHLQIHGSKMSKSLKNFVSIRDALDRGGWTPRGLRIVFLMGGWKEGIEVREGVLAEAKAWETTIGKFFSNVKALIAEEEEREKSGEKIPQLFGELENNIHKQLDLARENLHNALCDNFNTPVAMKVLSDLVSETNKYMAATKALSPVKEIARWITRIVNIFGLDGASASDKTGWSESSSRGAVSDAQDISLPYLRALSSFRDAVRQIAIANPSDASSKQLLQLSDKLRDYDLASLGVSLDDRDSADGKPALIKFVAAEELIAAREEKERKAREREAKKEEARKLKEEEERKKLEAAKLDPREMFKVGEEAEKWSEWDEEGLPFKDKEGVEVTKSRGKALRKAWERQKKAHEGWLKSQQ
ncbi:cysteinyl-tRNA synthetase [Rhizina undulata]